MPFLKINPQDFPLHIFAAIGEDVEFAVELPTSRWIPRVGERLILPLRDEENNIDYEWGFIVKEVIYDFVDQVVEVFCDLSEDTCKLDCQQTARQGIEFVDP